MTYYSKILLHMILMISFLVLFTVGIITARYYKKRTSNWLKIHKFLMISGLGSAFLGITWIVYVIQVDVGIHFTVPHHFLGAITFIVAAAAPFLGFKLMSRNTGNSVKPVLRKFHKLTGRLSFLLILSTIFTGLALFGIISVPFL